MSKTCPVSKKSGTTCPMSRNDPGFVLPDYDPLDPKHLPIVSRRFTCSSIICFMSIICARKRCA